MNYIMIALVSLLCLPAMSFGKNNLPLTKPVHITAPKALKIPLILKETKTCNAVCVSNASKFLSTKLLRLLEANQTPSIDRTLNALFSLEYKIEQTNIKTFGVRPGGKTQSNVTGIMSALALSKTESWPLSNVANLNKVIEGLKDGVSKEEKAKLEEIDKNCRV